jgi:hypothetical protein
VAKIKVASPTVKEKDSINTQILNNKYTTNYMNSTLTVKTIYNGTPYNFDLLIGVEFPEEGFSSTGLA